MVSGPSKLTPWPLGSNDSAQGQGCPEQGEQSLRGWLSRRFLCDLLLRHGLAHASRCSPPAPRLGPFILSCSPARSACALV